MGEELVGNPVAGAGYGVGPSDDHGGGYFDSIVKNYV